MVQKHTTMRSHSVPMSCLEMRDKVVEAIMTPLESVFMLSYDAHIDEKVMDNIKLQGHSRVPVYKGERDNIVGMLLVKRLIHLDPEDCTPVTDLEGANTSPPSCATTTPLFDLLNQFQTGCTSHPVSSVPGV
jgi:ankyrin repeat/SOCS box protein 13/metal transporter CNNM